MSKRFVSKKPICIAVIALLVVTILISALAIARNNVYAANKIFSITSAEVAEQSETTEVSDFGYEGTTIHADVVYH